MTSEVAPKGVGHGPAHFSVATPPYSSFVAIVATDPYLLLHFKIFNSGALEGTRCVDEPAFDSEQPP